MKDRPWYDSRRLRWTVVVLAAVGVFYIGSIFYSLVELYIDLHGLGQ
jgi:hypothetical protein